MSGLRAVLIVLGGLLILAAVGLATSSLTTKSDSLTEPAFDCGNVLSPKEHGYIYRPDEDRSGGQLGLGENFDAIYVANLKNGACDDALGGRRTIAAVAIILGAGSLIAGLAYKPSWGDRAKNEWSHFMGREASEVSESGAEDTRPTGETLVKDQQGLPDLFTPVRMMFLLAVAVMVVMLIVAAG